jgi:hypothetical protein
VLRSFTESVSGGPSYKHSDRPRRSPSPPLSRRSEKSPHIAIRKITVLKYLHLLGATIVAFLLFGCISYPRRPFAPPPATPITRIALVQVSEPLEIRVTNPSAMGNGFGLIGAGVVAATEEQRSNELAEVTGQLRSEVAQHLTHELESGLNKLGYTTSHEHLQPAVRSAQNFSYDYSNLSAPADALLHVWFYESVAGGAVSYTWDAASKVFRPNIVICARLVSKRNNAELYFQAFVYGKDYGVKNIEYLPFSPEFAFLDHETLISSASTVHEGLIKAVGEIAERITLELAHR